MTSLKMVDAISILMSEADILLRNST